MMHAQTHTVLKHDEKPPPHPQIPLFSVALSYVLLNVVVWDMWLINVCTLPGDL